MNNPSPITTVKEYLIEARTMYAQLYEVPFSNVLYSNETVIEIAKMLQLEAHRKKEK